MWILSHRLGIVNRPEPVTEACMSAKRLGIAIALLLMFGRTGSSSNPPSPDSLGYDLPRPFPVAASARLVSHADLNGDGKEDLILAGETQHMRERAVEILEGNGDGTFREGITIQVQNPIRAIVVADINGDGKPDLILLHPGVAVLLNTTPRRGAPVSFGGEQSLAGGFGPALAAADLNGDGKAEVLLGTTPTRDASDEQGTLRIVSTPAFTDARHFLGPAPTLDVPIPGVPISIVVSDFDGDGKPDIAVAFTGPLHERRGGVAVLLNRTLSSTAPIRFADPIVIAFDHAVDFASSADLDGDGRNDIFAVWCSGSHQPCAAASLLNKATPQGGIEFVLRSVPLTIRRASNWILQDINHDGKPDLLFLNRQQGVTFSIQTPAEIVVELGMGDGRFASPRTFSAPTADSLGMVLADFNNDGLFDLALLDAASAEVPKISLLLGTEDHGFSAPESLALGFVPTDVIPVSQHGKTAGFIATDIPQSAFPRTGHSVQVFVAKSLDPPFSPLSTITGVPEAALAVGDLNADGQLEMVAVTSAKVLVYSLERKAHRSAVQAATFPGSSSRFASAPRRAILVDVNGDGNPDLIVGNGYEPNLQIYMNTSGETFSFAPPVSVPWCPKGVPPPIMKGFVSLSLELASADLNGDGKPDLIASGRCGLNLLMNGTPDHAAAAFGPPVSVWGEKQSPWQAGVFALVDVNRDGKADILVTENSYTNLGGETSALDVLLNETTSAPTFRLAQHFSVSKRLAGLVAGDFNQDGWPDVATVDTDGTLTFLLNDQQWRTKGSFTVYSSLTVMASPQQLLLVAPFGSGLPRLVLRNQDSVAVVR
jgi:FG-GAP-like repeat/FG-GAP repeat